MTLTSFNHYKCKTIKVVQIRTLLSMYVVYFFGYDEWIFPVFFILLNNFNVFGRYPGKVKESKIT